MGSLLRWFVFSVAFGLLPFAFSVLLRLLHGEPPSLVQNAPELLFVALMLSAIQMGEMLGPVRPAASDRARGSSWRDAAFCFFLLMGTGSAVVYGVYVQAARGVGGIHARCAHRPVIGPECTQWMTFQSNVFSLSVLLAVGVGCMGTATELIRTWRVRWRRG